MDKKGNRNTSNSSRGSSGIDLKKSLDVSTSKQGARAATRRREPTCGFSKPSEANRKPQPQRNGKAADKRPKPRGFYFPGAISRNEEACLEQFDQPELGSVFSPGSKKQSLNHLLNFSFAPRDGYRTNSQFSRVDKDGKRLVTRKRAYNKDHYLQANCQFVVNEKGDYKKYLSNPDVLVDWNLVEQVNVQVDEQPSCPICLYPPVAAKMTKCGHIYCWPCMLHYLSLSDTQWCPICFDIVKKDDLKSVIVVPHKTFNVKDTIVFKLMKRLRGSLTAYPADCEAQPENIIYNISDKSLVNASSKLFSANVDNIKAIINREDEELNVLIAEDEDCPERCFIDQAKVLLMARLKILDDENEHKPVVVDEKDTLAESESSLSEVAGDQMAKYHYFYQAEDAQHIYLHAINAKMLEHTYGSLEFGPKTLEGEILEKEGGSMTEELRNKLRYLQHLPITCQFEVAEIKLDYPIITKDTVEHFKDQIEVRKKRRKKRISNELRREKKIQMEEDKKIGKYPTPMLHLESRYQFPEIPDVTESHKMFPDLTDLSRSESESTLISQSERSSSPDLSSSLSSNYASFSKVVATERQPSWPALKKSKQTSQSSSTPVKLLNVTGPNMTLTRSNSRPETTSDHEEFEMVPVKSQNFGDVIAEALQRGLELNDDNLRDEASVSGRKKKKKNKQKLLFSTRMAFPGN